MEKHLVTEIPNKQLLELWKKNSESEWVQGFKNGASLKELLNATRNSDEILKKEKCVCCDGRLKHTGNDFSVAGSFILCEEELEKNIKKIGFETLTSHEECGAGKLAFSQLDESISAQYLNAKDYVVKWTQATADRYGLKYEHINDSEFISPYHHEGGIILDSTLKFHPSVYSGMPNMFISNSPAGTPAEYIEAETKVLAGIAFGDHGFGSLLTADDPFYILITARTIEEEKKLVEIAKKATQAFGDAVAIKSCTL